MSPLIRMPLMVLAALVALDLAAAGALSVFEEKGIGGSLVNYFEYGRSTPGKIAKWQAEPDLPGNLYKVAWRPGALKYSAESFAKEVEGPKPVIRAYGMSFTDRILSHAETERPSLAVDSMGGPGASPNYVFAQFLDDRENRRPGDVAIIGILASSVSGMGAMSNQTRVFEQPAPFTFPIFRPTGGHGLERLDPIIESLEAQNALAQDPDRARAWHAQLAEEDKLYSPFAYALPWLDRSPFMRLVRRSLATSDISRREVSVLGDPDMLEALRRIVASFAKIAREDGQIPIVILLQNRSGAPDLMAVLENILEEGDIPYLLTSDIVDPSNPSIFEGDGHFKPEVDARLATAFLDILDRENALDPLRADQDAAAR